MKRVVILGGGFGGIYTALHLLKQSKNDQIEVLLINKTNYFLFSPLLHEVATGGLSRHNIVEPIREIIRQKNFRFVRCEVMTIDTAKKVVHAKTGSFSYDILVIALGAEANFHKIPGADTYAIPLKAMEDAVKIRNKAIDSLEHAAKFHDRENIERYLTFVIVGGGPTGVELAGELGGFINQAIQVDYPELKKTKQKVLLIQREKEVIPFMHESCREDAVKALEKNSVTIKVASEVTEVGSDVITINNREKVKTVNVFWTAGVKPVAIETRPHLQDQQGFFNVDGYLQVREAKDVYALGDCARFYNEGESRSLPALAQVATKQAKVLAKNIINKLNNKPQERFFFKPSGLLVSVGSKFAVADIRGIHLKGFFTWWLWRTIYLFKLLGFSNKLRVAYEWTLDLFFPRDTTEL